MHADLRLAGTLPPLDAPHHMRATEWAFFREGVVTRSGLGEGSLLNVGLDKVCAYHDMYACMTHQGNAKATNSGYVESVKPKLLSLNQGPCIQLHEVLQAALHA